MQPLIVRVEVEVFHDVGLVRKVVLCHQFRVLIELVEARGVCLPVKSAKPAFYKPATGFLHIAPEAVLVVDVSRRDVVTSGFGNSSRRQLG